MPLSKEQIEQLEAPLDGQHVSERKQSGITLSYIEGWFAIAEANRIFGHDNWHRETVDIKLVAEKERKIGQAGIDGWGVTYVAKARITVGDIVREGWGTGHGIDKDLGQAHESAIKEAETDAMKRGLMTFGWPFGLALYDKSREHVVNGAQKKAQPGAGVRGAASGNKWHGPQKITELQQNLKAFAEQLDEIQERRELDDLLMTFHDTLEQAKKDRPEWMDRTDKTAADFTPLNERIAAKQQLLDQVGNVSVG